MNEPLTNQQIRKLKALAQRLEPTVKLGKNGMSEAFLKMVNEMLDLHELIKVKFAEFKAEKKKMAPLMAEKTSSHLVTRVGNVAVLFRRNPDPDRQKIKLP